MGRLLFLEVAAGFEPAYTALQAVASPLGHATEGTPSGRPLGAGRVAKSTRADDGIRTRDPHLGKVMLYQLSHVRVPSTGVAAGDLALCRLGGPVSQPSRQRDELYRIHAADQTRFYRSVSAGCGRQSFG